MSSQVVQHYGDRVRQIQRGVSRLAVQRQNPLAQSEFIVGEAAVFSAKHQGMRGISGQKPVDRCVWGLQRYAAVIQPATGRNHPTAVTNGGLQIRVDGGLPQQGGGMDGHPECIVTEDLTTGIHQAQSVNAEIGAEPGHTADVQRPGRLDEDNDDGQLSLCR